MAMGSVHNMNSRDRQLIGIVCGVPFGLVGMIVFGGAAWVINLVLGKLKR